ncbi:MAG: hypothetical protein UX49_C0018G0024 [Candidatus Wolfebacteria bacterium GW2011_GWC2_46_275]|nr:MAG: hypothetical protein UX70_C0001G0331 [Candidatus Wolfebacteria bacterium GW2011_GWB1_47_1]KKU36327.1 MAG: hypothetical protein UX49_C0018G0024 [Candidatus Wolfebacteria bacterium GW2011_GWC2_46_275]KKU54156.1 MAG: hypothetical protein UX76_C0005G0029 [Candidatus Wolfebacteria bacterium GW2011_GWC1_47_103]KKU72805.1 MAG: hypothetical protein UX96_C0014G0029 [Candidatus Wolfebacteria bacterium GW2011_GWB1_47_243]KKU74784.1 MAG: hypothetical protein UY00_C0057G0008 [Candidatus Wolfebacteri
MINFLKHSVFPAGFLIASIIGAGMFALPFVFQQAGLVIAVLYLGFFGIVAALIHLIYADIVLRTRETRHQFPGYIRQYLGNTLGRFSSILVTITLLFTLTAYLILSIGFSHILAPSLSSLVALLFFWALSTAVIFINIKHTALFDAMTTTITLIAIGAIFLYWGSSVPFNTAAFPLFNFNAGLIPFGPVLFSFLGFSAIPPLIAYVRKEAVPFNRMKKAVVVGSLIPAFFYLLFVLAVWGMSRMVSPDSVSGLVDVAPFPILLVISILGIVSLWDSYAAIGRDLHRLFEYEWSIPSSASFLLVAGAPLILYVLGFQDFIAIISAVGGILFSIWGILIILAWKKAIQVSVPSVKFSNIYIPDRVYSIINDIPPFIIDTLLVIFAGGIAYSSIELISSFAQ